jgi:hypothetical protein
MLESPLRVLLSTNIADSPGDLAFMIAKLTPEFLYSSIRCYNDYIEIYTWN